MSALEWQTNLGYAEDSALSARKPILLDVYDPSCIGCQQMDAVTYAAKDVVQFIKDHLIPLRKNVSEKSFYEKYPIIWTPTTIILDYDGNEQQRNVGFFAPDEFIPMLFLGMAKVRFGNGEFDGAQFYLNSLLNHYPESEAAPEAMYFKGVNHFKQKNNPQELKTTYEELLAKHPGSAWTKRAAPYRLL